MNLSTSRGWAPSRDAVITTSTPETNVVFAGVVRGRERHAAYGELRLAGTDLRYGVAAEQQHRGLAVRERGGAVFVPFGQRIGLGVLVQLGQLAGGTSPALCERRLVGEPLLKEALGLELR